MCAISATEKITGIDTDSADIQNIETDDEIKTGAPIEAEIIPLNLENEYQSGDFSFKLVDKNTGEGVKNQEIILIMDSYISPVFNATTSEDGIAYFKTNKLFELTYSNRTYIKSYLDVGVHPIKLSARGNVTTPIIKTDLVINKATATIEISPLKEYCGADENITITLTNAKDGSPLPGIALHLHIPQLDIKDYYIRNFQNTKLSQYLSSFSMFCFDRLNV